MRRLLIFMLFLFSCSILYSQTEKDYYEWIRNHNERRKIKKIITEGYTDYIDEKGYHVKREFDAGNYRNVTHLQDGSITVEVVDSEGTFTMTGSPALYYYTGFEPYNITEKVEMIFDDKNNLIQENIYTDGYIIDYTTKYYYEILLKYPSRSEYYNGNELFSNTKYLYDGKGILLKETTKDVKTGKTYYREFTYEYYE